MSETTAPVVKDSLTGAAKAAEALDDLAMAAALDPVIVDGKDVETLRQRIREIEAALFPFAEKARARGERHALEGFKRPLADSLQVSHRFGDFRRALEVLGGAA